MSSEQQIRVRFFTRQTEQYAIPDVAMMVPIRFRRYGLSEIINHLLATETPIPFDFLIDKQLLRVSLEEYVNEKQLSTENTLLVEVIESLVPPKQIASYPHDDWLSSVDSRGSFFLTGCYDQRARIWNQSGECVLTMHGHRAPIKAVRWLDDARCITASQDQTLRVWETEHLSSSSSSPIGASASARTVLELVGHEGSVDTVDVAGGMILSGSWDASIRLWTTAVPEPEDSAAEEPTASQLSRASHKKRKTVAETVVQSPLATLNGHAGPVTGVVFDKNSPATTFYSGSHDHTVRAWDSEARAYTNSMSCDQAVLCLDHSKHNGLLATGHSDRLLRLWDARSQDGTMVKLKLAAHTSWVSSVCWAPESSYLLVSGSYDGALKVWDIRSTAPIYTVAPQEKPANKILCAHWSASPHGLLLSAGEEGKLRIHSYRTANHDKEEEMPVGK